MTEQEIVFFRTGLTPFYDAALEQFTADLETTKQKMAPYRVKNAKGKAAGIFRGIGNLFGQILFHNAVSDNVTEGDFDIDLNRFRAKDQKTALKMKILRTEKKGLERLVKDYQTIREMLADDRKVPKLADALYETMDICNRHHHSDFTFSVIYINVCGLLSDRKYPGIVILEDLHKLPRECHIDLPEISKYKLKFNARAFADELFENYRKKFKKKYSAK